MLLADFPISVHNIFHIQAAHTWTPKVKSWPIPYGRKACIAPSSSSWYLCVCSFLNHTTKQRQNLDSICDLCSLPLLYHFFPSHSWKQDHMQCFVLHNLAAVLLEKRPLPDPGALLFLSNRSRTIAVNYKNDKTFPGELPPFISLLQSPGAGQPSAITSSSG